jgi:hypothetical protein
MNYTNAVFTRKLNELEYKSCLLEIIDILKCEKVLEIEIMFGFAWGNEYKDWTPFTVSLDNIMTQIDEAEKKTGTFFEEDTFLYLHDITTGILFCHEHDIHLDYNETNKIVAAIISAWETKNIIQEK